MLLGDGFTLLFLEESFWEVPKKSIDLTAHKRYFHEGQGNDMHFAFTFLEHFLLVRLVGS
jgi:hypothetical protein